MQGCMNCRLKRVCAYRGIIDPCLDWGADQSIKLMQQKVKTCQTKRVSFWERRFLNSMTKRLAYTRPMETIIEQIFAR